MGAPYSQDLRSRVLTAYDNGKQTKEIAKSLSVSASWARRVKQVRREAGRTTPLPMGGVRVVKVDVVKLAELVQQQPDATIAELHQRLGVDSCSQAAVAMALDRLDLSLKKRRSMRPSRTGRMSLKNACIGASSKPSARAHAVSSSMRPGPKPT